MTATAGPGSLVSIGDTATITSGAKPPESETEPGSKVWLILSQRGLERIDIAERRVKMDQLTNKQWWKAAGTRAIKTSAQAAIATIGSTAVLGDVSWKLVISASILSGILSLLTSLAGLPEVED